MIGGRYVSAQQHPKEKRQITSLLEPKALSLPKGLVENRRAAGGPGAPAPCAEGPEPAGALSAAEWAEGLHLGEIDGSQQDAWQKTIEIFEDGQPHPKTVARAVSTGSRP